MDKPRTGFAEKRRVRRILIVAAAAVVISLVTFGISRIEPAAPPVKKETVWTDEVKRGPMLLEVRGPGTLVPVDIRFISAPVDGRVERIPALPGVRVEPDTVLLELSDPQVEQAALEAESQLRAAQADYEDLRAQLDSQLLNQQSQVNAAQSQAEQAKLQAEADEVLAKDGLIPDLDFKLSRMRAEQSVKQSKIEGERYRKSQQLQQRAARRPAGAGRPGAHGLRAAPPAGRVAQGARQHLRRAPGAAGPGRPAGHPRHGPGAGRPAREAQGRAAHPGDTGQGRPAGPAGPCRHAQRHRARPRDPRRPLGPEGTVIVDVALEGALPRGARPDLRSTARSRSSA